MPSEVNVREADWELHMIVDPTDDGRFFSLRIEVRRPFNRTPIIINTSASTDLMHTKIEGELSNALRHITNDISQTVIKPQQQKRRS